MKLKEINLTKKQKVLIILSLLGLLGIGNIIVRNTIKNNQATDVVIEEEVEIYTLPGEEKIYLTGSITPVNQEEIFKESDNGDIDKFYVIDGQSVSKGENLFRYKNESKIEEIKDIESEILELKNEISNLKKQMKEESIVDENDILEKEKEIKKLTKKKNILDSQIYTVIKAPFKGVVYINKEQNNSMNNQSEENQNPLMTIQSLDYNIKSQVNEYDFLKIKEKDLVDIFIFSTKENRTGYIKSISKKPSSGTSDYGTEALSYYDVYIVFDEQENLINGFHAQALIKKELSTFKIPATAIVKEDDKNYVYKVVDGIAKKKEVKIEENEKEADFVTVIEGLAEEMTIIRYPDENTKDGMEVNVNIEVEDEEIEIEL